MHPLERFLAILGAILCATITLVLWVDFSAYQAIWPMPGLYFLELPGLTILCALLVLAGKPRAGMFTWACAGGLVAFMLLGAFSVGFFYLPVVLVFISLGIVMLIKRKGPVALHLFVFMLAGVLQAALMLAAIRILYPGAIF